MDQSVDKRQPEFINRIDTHVVWEEYSWGFMLAHQRRIALARQLNWVAYDLQIGQLIASPTGSTGQLFDPSHALPPKSKSSIEMSSVQYELSHRARPKGSIFGKDGNTGNSRWFQKTPSGEWLFGLSSGVVADPRECVLQVRNTSFELLSELEGVGSVACLSPSGSRLIGRSATCGGYQCRSSLIDVQEKKLKTFMPFVGPFVWQDEVVFYAFPPRQGDWDSVVKSRSHEVSRSFSLTPKAGEVIAEGLNRVLRVSLSDGSVDCVQSEPLDSCYGEDYRSIALAVSQENLFLATRTSVGSLNLQTTCFEWQRELAKLNATSFHTINEIALSPCGKLLAVVSNGESSLHPYECVVLNVADGEVVLATPLTTNSSVVSVAWHRSGWLACGLGNGGVVLLDMNGSMRQFKASQKGIKTLRFDQGTLIIAGTEKQIRVFPLLEDEAAGELVTVPVAPRKPSSAGSSLIKKVKVVPLPEALVSKVDLNLPLSKALAYGSALKSLENLESLTISGKGSLASVLLHLRELPKLRCLKISFNPVGLGAEIGELQDLTQLILNDNGMSSLPEEIGKLASLQSLALVDNKVATLPATMKNLVNIESLYLSRNELSEVPSWLGELTALKRLEMGQNKLRGALGDWTALSSLEHLVMLDNQFSGELEVEGLTKLKNISLLHLGNEGMTSVPKELWQLSSLKRLTIKDVAMREIPEAVGQLTELAFLSVINAGVSKLPVALFDLKSLLGLNVSQNVELVLPEDISRLEQLQYLWIENNGYDYLPAKIREMPMLRFIYVHGNNVKKLKEALNGCDGLKVVAT